MDALIEKIVRHMLSATPSEMGGTPDLFQPEGGWEKWETDARSFAVAAENQSLSTYLAPIPGEVERGHGVREAPAPGFMQPNGKRIGGA